MNNKKTIISIAAVVAVAAGIFGIASVNKQSSTPITDTTASQTTTPVADTATTTTTTKTGTTSTTKSGQTYKDGTYTATGSYRSPAGNEQIGVSVTLKDDVIAAVSATPMATDRTSSRYQALFISGYQPLVLGESIASVHLDAVSGSSLTPVGFNDALTQIKAKAQA